ncbi:MAG: hypothetical protein ACJATA_001783, partial [Sphingobacteriales bacterium]
FQIPLRKNVKVLKSNDSVRLVPGIILKSYLSQSKMSEGLRKQSLR